VTEHQKELRRQMPFVNQVVGLLEHWKLQKQTVSVLAIANGLHRIPGEVHRLFELFGLQPVSWQFPEDYEVATIIETLTRHEVAARYNRAGKGIN
jgi:ABC-type proline/glycine betaine transport system ATPase subunit